MNSTWSNCPQWALPWTLQILWTPDEPQFSSPWTPDEHQLITHELCMNSFCFSWRPMIEFIWSSYDQEKFIRSSSNSLASDDFVHTKFISYTKKGSYISSCLFHYPTTTAKPLISSLPSHPPAPLGPSLTNPVDIVTKILLCFYVNTVLQIQVVANVAKGVTNEATIMLECEISTWKRNFPNTIRAETHVPLFIVARIKAGDGICWFGQWCIWTIHNLKTTMQRHLLMWSFLLTWNRRLWIVEYLVWVGDGVGR